MCHTADVFCSSIFCEAMEMTITNMAYNVKRDMSESEPHEDKEFKIQSLNNPDLFQPFSFFETL